MALPHGHPSPGNTRGTGSIPKQGTQQGATRAGSGRKQPLSPWLWDPGEDACSYLPCPPYQQEAPSAGASVHALGGRRALSAPVPHHELLCTAQLSRDAAAEVGMWWRPQTACSSAHLREGRSQALQLHHCSRRSMKHCQKGSKSGLAHVCVRVCVVSQHLPLRPTSHTSFPQRKAEQWSTDPKLRGDVLKPCFSHCLKD